MSSPIIDKFGRLPAPYDLPVLVVAPIYAITIPLFAYSVLTVHIDKFFQYGLIIGLIYWALIAIFLARPILSPWSQFSRAKKIGICLYLATSPIPFAMMGMVFFGVLHPIWLFGHWLFSNYTQSLFVATLAGASTLILGALLFWFRLHFRFLYGMTEVATGMMVASHRSYIAPEISTLSETSYLIFLLTACVYLVVRGIDNMYIGMRAEPRDGSLVRLANWWSKLGHVDTNVEDIQAKGSESVQSSPTKKREPQRL